MLAVGVDIGGTFTDVILYESPGGRIRSTKALSTPEAPTAAIIAGLEQLGVALDEVDKIVHGTTRVTNALLEDAGERVGLLTTEGFRDVLEMGLGHRPRLYHAQEPLSPVLVPRSCRHAVRERMRADGMVETPLDAETLDAAIAALSDSGIAAVAVCFLHADRNPSHEQAAVARVTERYPKATCSASADVVPEQGEYERFVTTVLNASVRGVVSEYLGGLRETLGARGYARPISIVTSSGGIVSAAEASRRPIRLALSGPAGGVAASAALAELTGLGNVITCDIGGTSTDVCLIRDARPTMTSQGQIAGRPNRTFQIDINTIGAGGGSVAWRDVGGELRVGPRSAGSTPGPACYGRGGTEPTTTDAHLLVGHLDEDEPLGGQVRLRRDEAMAAMCALAGELGVDDPHELARGVLRLATAKMTSAIKEISVARGHDPRDFVLMPFGGAGPMHATALADELGISSILVPSVPGNFSALGFVAARIRHDYVRTVLADADDRGVVRLGEILADLQAQARQELATEYGIAADAAEFGVAVGMRFRGQSFDLPVEFAAPPASVAELRQAFETTYARRYSYVRGNRDVEIVNCRLTAFGPAPEMDFDTAASIGAPTPGTTRVFGEDGWVQAAVWRRDALARGAELTGPAVVREPGCTTVIGPGWRGVVDARANLSLHRD